MNDDYRRGPARQCETSRTQDHADVWPEFWPAHYVHAVKGKGVNPELRQADGFYIGRRDGWLCAYCGIGLEYKSGPADDPAKVYPTVDHIVPRKLGGGDTNLNAVLACMPCNRRKGIRHPRVMVTF